jgi:uncharacterized oxidoreductase
MPRLTAEEVTRVSIEILRAAGAPEDHATIVTRHLVDANLAGHDSHGVMRLPQYVEEIGRGQISPEATETVVRDWAGGAVIDARGALGQVACYRAMERALDKAKERGVGVVTVRSCGHSGRLGTYGELAAAKGRIGMVFNNAGGSGQWVAPFGGSVGRLSTNPLCIAAPSAGEFPIVIDMSTCVAPEGKVRHTFQSGKPAPDGWLIDAQGRPTNDPGALYETPRGALLPFGESAGHKGFGLSFLVDVLAGALTDAGCARPDAPHQSPGRGLLFLALDVEVFTSLDGFRSHVETLVDYVRSCPPAPGFEEVLAPGEFEYRRRQERQRDGFEIPEQTWQTISDLHADTQA